MSEIDAKQKEREAFETYDKRELVDLVMRLKDELRTARASSAGQFEDGVARGKYLATREIIARLEESGYREHFAAAGFLRALQPKGADHG